MKEKFLGLDILLKLITINVIVFVAVNAIILFSPIENLFEWHNSVFPLSTTANLERLIFIPWTILTHMFLHFGIGHIFWNMIILYISGKIFMFYFNEKKVLSIYLLGGLAGLVSMILIGLFNEKLGSDSPAFGASAAVMAILVSGAAYAPNHNLRLLLFGDVKYWLVATVLVIIDFVSLNNGPNFGGHIAHLGGAAFGFLFGRQFKNGNDIALGFEAFMDKISNLFKKREKIRVVKSTRKTPYDKDYKSDEQYSYEKKMNQKRLDEILDKISKSGYDSLSKAEKDFLFKQSKD